MGKTSGLMQLSCIYTAVEVHSVLTGQERNHRVIYVRKDFKIIESHHKETAVEEKALCIPVQVESALPILTFFSMKLPFTWKIRH